METNRASAEAGSASGSGAKAPRERGWLIRKAGINPFDSAMASIIGPSTHAVEVVPEEVACELREAIWAAEGALSEALLAGSLSPYVESLIQQALGCLSKPGADAPTLSSEPGAVAPPNPESSSGGPA